MIGAWQDLAVGAAAIVALAWLIRRRLRKKAACADCALAEAVFRAPGAAGRSGGAPRDGRSGTSDSRAG